MKEGGGNKLTRNLSHIKKITETQSRKDRKTTRTENSGQEVATLRRLGEKKPLK